MDFYVAAVAASGRGIGDLQTFFQHLPPRPGVAFIVVSHLPRTPESKLADIIARSCELPVTKVNGAVKLQPDQVYVIAENTTLHINNDILNCEIRNADIAANTAIDQLLTSLAKECGDKAIGIILGGMGTDGLNGVIAIEKAGGYVIAQMPENTRDTEMTYNVIVYDEPHTIAELENIPGHLMNYLAADNRGEVNSA